MAQQHGGPVDADAALALQDAAERNDVAFLAALLDAGADVSAAAGGNGRTALHAAVSSGCLDAAALLLERGAAVDAVDDSGNTPLHLAAARHGQPSAVALAHLLIEAGANVEAVNADFEKTPLLVALSQIEDSSTDFVEALLDAGANVNAADRANQSALHHAAIYGHPAAVQLLLERGAAVNAADDPGRTALHLTVFEVGGLERPNADAVAAALLDAGADPDASDNGGYTALNNALRDDADCAAVFDVLLADRLARARATWARERATWERERAAWARERAAWARERDALAREREA